MAATNVQAFSGDIQLPIGSSLTTNINDTFTHDGEQMPHVGLQWRTHTDFAGGQVGQLSAYKGFKFFTEGTEKVTILNDGKVGFGTASPGAPLEIYTPTTGNSSTLILKRDVSSYGGSDDGAAIEFKTRFTGNSASYGQVRIRGVDDNVGDSGEGGFAFDTLQDQVYYERMRIKHDGNVGIGTNNPGKKLTVAGNMELGVNNGSYQHLRLGGGNSSGFLYSAFAKYPDTINLGYNFYNDNSSNQIPNAGGGTSRVEMGYGGLKLHTGTTNTEPNNNALCINSDGKVGIRGITNATDSLHVSGPISSQNGHGSIPKLVLRSGASNTNSWQVYANVSDAYAGNFVIDRLDGGSAAKFMITNSGYVGINTSNATDNLHIFETGGVGTSDNPFPAVVLQHYTAAGAPAWGDVTGDLCLNYHSWDGYRGSGVRAFRDSYANVRNSSVYLYTGNGTPRFTALSVGDCQAAAGLRWSNQSTFDLNITLQAPNAVYYSALCYYWNTYSSRKLKENIETIPDALSKVKRLRGVHFTWKQGQGDNVAPNPGYDYDHTKLIKQQTQVGFIADEVAEVLPTVCGFDNNDFATSVDYGAITPVLVNAIKELDIKIGKSEASSDDRLKDNEVYIENAIKTLMKLKPQVYDKKESLSSNVYQHEAGLIAQDIWYDAPELRFAVKPGLLSEIPLEAPTKSGDPREDPDYSKWGPNPASVDYNYLIPYTIKSIQEIYTELPRHKTQVIGITPANLNDYRGLLVSSDTNALKNDIPILSITQKSYDKKCFGVVSFSNTHTMDNEILVDTKSCGSIWVINYSDIESGDYLTSSNIAGYAMKQNDDILHNYTVAKSSIDCDFTPVQKTVKRVKQELSNVTYYVKTDLFEITKEQYDAMDDMYKMSREHSFYTLSEYIKVSGKGGYDKMEYYKEITDKSVTINDKVTTLFDIISIDDWTILESNTQNTYSPYYSNLITTQVSLEDYSTLEEDKRSKCAFTTKTLYYYKIYTESKDLLPGYEPEVRQEYINVLDENGQLQWEDTQQTEDSYKLRYLDVHGNITDQTNAVHTAALIKCTHCF